MRVKKRRQDRDGRGYLWETGGWGLTGQARGWAVYTSGSIRKARKAQQVVGWAAAATQRRARERGDDRRRATGVARLRWVQCRLFTGLGREGRKGEGRRSVRQSSNLGRGAARHSSQLPCLSTVALAPGSMHVSVTQLLSHTPTHTPLLAHELGGSWLVCELCSNARWVQQPQ